MSIEVEDFKSFYVDITSPMPLREIKWTTGTKNVIEFDGTEFKEHAQFRDWCLENCDGKIIFVEKQANITQGTIKVSVFCYYEQDAAAIKLRWL